MTVREKFILKWKEQKPDEFWSRFVKMQQSPTDRLFLVDMWWYGWTGLQFTGEPDLIQKSVEAMFQHRIKNYLDPAIEVTLEDLLNTLRAIRPYPGWMLQSRIRKSAVPEMWDASKRERVETFCKFWRGGGTEYTSVSRTDVRKNMRVRISPSLPVLSQDSLT